MKTVEARRVTEISTDGDRQIITCQLSLQTVTPPAEMPRSEKYHFLKSVYEAIIPRLLSSINEELVKAGLVPINADRLSVTVFGLLYMRIPLSSYQVVTKLMAEGKLPAEVKDVTKMPHIPVVLLENHR